MSGVYGLDCDEGIVLNPHIRPGERAVCPHCGAHLEVIGTDPPELDWVCDWPYEEDEGEDRYGI